MNYIGDTSSDDLRMRAAIVNMKLPAGQRAPQPPADSHVTSSAPCVSSRACRGECVHAARARACLLRRDSADETTAQRRTRFVGCRPSCEATVCTRAMSGPPKDPKDPKDGAGGGGRPRSLGARSRFERLVGSLRGVRVAAELREHSPTPEDLGLKTLRQVYASYARIISPVEKERQLYKILPLFCKNCSKLGALELVTKFPEVYEFAESVAILFVRHITQLAQSAHSRAGTALLRYFEASSSEGGEETGLLILRTIHVLSDGPEDLIAMMMSASDVTSILVRCIHLFLDLPPPVLAVKDGGVRGPWGGGGWEREGWDRSHEDGGRTKSVCGPWGGGRKRVWIEVRVGLEGKGWR